MDARHSFAGFACYAALIGSMLGLPDLARDETAIVRNRTVLRVVELKRSCEHRSGFGKRQMQANAAKAKTYRERADEIRKISADVRDDAARKYLLDVAADCEEMARTANPAPRE